MIRRDANDRPVRIIERRRRLGRADGEGGKPPGIANGSFLSSDTARVRSVSELCASLREIWETLFAYSSIVGWNRAPLCLAEAPISDAASAESVFAID